MSGQEPSEEELRAAMEEQLRRVSVQDVLMQTAATLVSLAGRRLGLAPEAKDERDLEQARLAIEGTRALVPLLSSEEASAVRQALSQLQVAYAREAQAGEGQPDAETAPAEAGDGEPGGQPDAEGGRSRPETGARPGAEDAERAKARSRIWTPPGS